MNSNFTPVEKDNGEENSGLKSFFALYRKAIPKGYVVAV
jgi:hypothetical protein